MSKEHISALTSSHASLDRNLAEARKPLNGSNYCYMFPKLADSAASTSYGDDAKTHAILIGLSHMMGRNGATRKPLQLPPVYTYFGQFLSHDLTAPVPQQNGEFLGLASGIIAAIVDSADIDSTQRPDKGTAVLARLRNQHQSQ